ncbi:hypothetical protein Cgig2_014808 [Carnegiea gigantea]|uniref:THH1/TOM1/TOM3 domain-containing protein n=1 Tax=Carnegiea gigantea TaxID=171969 RepID=A0A9Q1QUT1_9CARY|nr:hypothetical protein Cgig2_014808 [Carnegiea gigantea]
MTDGSKDLEEGVYYTLCACYALVAFVALVQLVRIQMRVPEYGWTTQKVFHFMNFIVNGRKRSETIHFFDVFNLFEHSLFTEISIWFWTVRAILFGFYKKVFRIKPHAFEVTLVDLPGLLFFSTYTLLVLFWAEIYHQARSLPTDTLRPAYYIANGIVYFIQIVIWIAMRLSRSHAALEATKLFLSGNFFMHSWLGSLLFGFSIDDKRLEKVKLKRMMRSLKFGGAVVSLSAALGFLIYGGRLFFMLRRFPIESRGRQKKLFEAAISAFKSEVDVDVLDHPVGNLVYYMVRWLRLFHQLWCSSHYGSYLRNAFLISTMLSNELLTLRGEANVT